MERKPRRRPAVKSKEEGAGKPNPSILENKEGQPDNDRAITFVHDSQKTKDKENSAEKSADVSGSL